MNRSHSGLPRVAAKAAAPLAALSAWASTLLFLLTGSPLAAVEPPLWELRTQTIGNTIYFHVCFGPPGDMRAPLPPWPGQPPASEVQRRMLARMPQLIPQDDKAHAVYLRLVLPHFLPVVGFEAPRAPVAVKGLEFVGKLSTKGKGKFLLLYPTETENQPKAAGKKDFLQPEQEHGQTWAEVPLELDFAAAEEIVAPDDVGKRLPHLAPTSDDLEGLWAAAQAARLALLEVQAPEFGFYGFACAATGRKYGVAAPALDGEANKKRESIHRRLYETTTGAAALTESLQLHRFLNPENFRDRGWRTVDIWKLPGITIAEHPWEKMLAGKKPDPEPLAQLIPHDNYYVHFKNIAKFIELGELLDQWGTNTVRAYEINSRDYYLKERYERQLCLQSSWMGKTFGPVVVRGLAVTGSDGYVREGSDVTVIFQVSNRPAFLAAVEPFLREARRQFQGELKETKADYHGIPVEIYVTPLREVSLHRAVLGEFVIYSNSATGLRRVLDTHQGRLKALADSLDFQYMRTIFRLEDAQEDGFAFLSDAFIRQLVGPASKIKEKRRLEALTSLAMLTHGAMFAAWESGKLPESHAALLADSALKPDMIYTPEGRGAVWDPVRRAAVSDVYNTLNFPTPLIELPIDKVTPDEEQKYLQFRQEYQQLWRQYFDPVGMRFSLTGKPTQVAGGLEGKQVRVETYILPMIRTSRYDFLREVTGGGTIKVDSGRFLPHTLVQFIGHLAQPVADGVGDWVSIQLDDGPEIGKLLEFLRRQELQPQTANGDQESEEAARVAFQLPLTAGISIGDKQAFATQLENIKSLAPNLLGPYTRERLKPPYKGVTITRIQFAADSVLAQFLKSGRNPPVIFHAQVHDAWYVSLREASLKQVIDQSLARAEAKKAGRVSESVEVNSTLYVSPAAASKSREALSAYLEWESHRRALINCPIWYALYRAGLVSSGMDKAAKKAVAMRYLGFVPVSPDGALFAYDPKRDEVVNRRHGSPARPVFHPGVEAASPLAQLLDQFRNLRVDVRFREDGLHTVLTLERNERKRFRPRSQAEPGNEGGEK